MRTGFCRAFALVCATGVGVAFAEDVKKTYTSEDVVKFMIEERAKAEGRSVSCNGEDCAPKSFDMLITFDLNSANLKPESKENLRKVADALRNKAFEHNSFRIEGFTDARGPDAYNMKLSKDRARAVENFLAENNVESSRMTAEGFGAKSPRDPDPFSAGNRRVELKLKTR